MDFSNDRQFPSEVQQFLTWSDYNMGGQRFDISATKLLDSPQIAAFWKEFGKVLVEDSAGRVYASMGSGIHSRFEAANASNPDVMCEKRFMAEFPHPLDRDPFICGTPFIKSGVPIPDTSDWEKDPLVVSGQIDSYNFKTKTLADLKTVSAWKIVKQDYSSFEKQLNICALLMAKNGFTVEKLQVYALIRDWSRGRVGEKDYPNSNIQIIDIPMWDEQEQEDYITERLKLHFGDGEKTCSDSERWARPGSFAVKQTSKKRALRVLPTREKIDSWLLSQGHEVGKKGISIEERPATYARCADYCSFKQWCNQYQEDK